MRAADSDPSERLSAAASGEDAWALPVGDDASGGERFKWGWNSETAEATVLEG